MTGNETFGISAEMSFDRLTALRGSKCTAKVMTLISEIFCIQSHFLCVRAKGYHTAQRFTGILVFAHEDVLLSQPRYTK